MNDLAAQMAYRYSFDEVVQQLKERRKLSSCKKIYTSFIFHYTVWCSTGVFKDQINHNIEYLKLLLEEVVKRPGAGLALHFEIFDYEVIREYRPDVWKLIEQGMENKSLDVLAGGIIDYAAIISPISDLKRNHMRWHEYIQSTFGISTEGAFLWPNESIYHPNMPEIWSECDLGGIVLFPFHRKLKEHNFEPLILKSNAKDDSVVIATFNDDSKLFDVHRFAYAIDEKHTWQHRYLQFLELGARYSSPDINLFDKPIFVIGHDITLFKPKELGVLLDQIIADDVLEVTSLRDYMKIAEPKHEIWLDQGGWDTNYHWERSSEGWFTQQPWCLHINGLAYKANQDYDTALKLSEGKDDLNLHKKLDEAEEGLLYSERSTARAHWMHPGPRKWSQKYALKSLDITNKIINNYLEQSANNGKNKDDIFIFNPYEDNHNGLICLNVDSETDLQGSCIVIDQSNGQKYSGCIMDERIDSVTGKRIKQLLFNCQLPSDCISEFRIEPADNDKSQAICIDEKDGILTAENDVMKIQWDLKQNGQISNLISKQQDTSILKSGDVFAGHTLNREFSGFKNPDTEVLLDSSKLEWKLLHNGPEFSLLEISVPFVPAIGSKTIQYTIEKSSSVIRASYSFYFTEPTWFPWDYEQCARIMFEADVTDPQLRWQMPGGWLKPKYPVDEWSGFDNFGALLIGNDQKGVALVPKLYPNGLRMALSNRKKLGFSFAGIQRLKPYFMSSCNLGPCCFEMAIVPNNGVDDLAAVEKIESEYNKHFYACGVDGLKLSSPESIIEPFPDERFGLVDESEGYEKRFLSALT